ARPSTAPHRPGRARARVRTRSLRRGTPSRDTGRPHTQRCRDAARTRAPLTAYPRLRVHRVPAPPPLPPPRGHAARRAVATRAPPSHVRRPATIAAAFLCCTAPLAPLAACLSGQIAAVPPRRQRSRV